MPLDVLISVVCTNNRPALEGCLEALPDACEGIAWKANVVDNAGEDGTAETVRERFPWAQLIRNERRMGFSHNHNLTIEPAIAEGTSRYLLVLNDDTVLDPGALTQMVAEMDTEHDIGVLGPQIRGTDGRPQRSLFMFPSVARLVARQFQWAGPGPEPQHGWLNGSCLLMRAEAVEAVGSLDPEFFIFYEDTDLGLRMHKHGWRSMISKRAGMVHLEHSTISSPDLSSPMTLQMLRSQWIYVVRHHGRAQALIASAGTRAALLMRSLKARIGALLGNRDERDHAKRLFELARYRPKQRLPHESAA